jgi:KipI family sensor histidine kinase inhibitor
LPSSADLAAVHRPSLTPYGEHGLLLELSGEQAPSLVVRWAEAVRAAELPGVLDVVPAARSVLLHLASGTSPQQVGRQVAEVQLAPTADRADRAVVELPVVYDGPDLEQVAVLVGLDAAGVVGAHTGCLWQVAFAGFAPGFAYLTSEDGRLSVPRRPEPRTRVPAGAVALAAGYSAVYPRDSPGGWLLIGHTTRTLWDLERDPPAVLTPGQRVRFVAGAG